MIRWFEHGQVYRPTRDWVATADQLGRAWEDVSIKTSDGVKLSAWFFPANEDSPRKHLVALVCHGNGGEINHRPGLFGGLLGGGGAVVVFHFLGGRRRGGRGSQVGA